MTTPDPRTVPGMWGFVTVSTRPDGTAELRPAYVDRDGDLSYSPDLVSGFRPVPPAIRDTWITHCHGDAWVPFVTPAGSVHVDEPSAGSVRLGLSRG